MGASGRTAPPPADQRTTVHGVRAWHDPDLCQSVASELRTHRATGLAGLLTEDTLRFAVARALVDAGADPTSMRIEWPHPTLTGSRIDLVVGLNSPADRAVIELKYPREPSEVNAAWTMTLGEVLKDRYRLALTPGEADRLFVYLESPRLRRYMSGAARRYGLDLDADQVVLNPAAAAALPRTMITAHLCANAPDKAAVTYDDLERVDRGLYRLRTRSC